MLANPSVSANSIIERELHSHLSETQKFFRADVIAIFGPLYYGLEDQVRFALEKKTHRRPRLVVILETSGGYIEVAQRIADTFRQHYRVVDFVVPNFAMSAGTVLVMSGDAIYMDYFSVLGPIDPQVQENDNWVPALGYIKKFNQLIEKSNSGKLSSAELTFLVSKFNPAELYAYEQAKNLSEQLLKQWLVKYKFKDWKVTEKRRLRVTKEMKLRRAEEIAAKLNDTDRWNSHARPISMAVLKRELNLRINDYEPLPVANNIKCYYRLLRDYLVKRGHRWVIHSEEEFKGM